MSLRRTPLTRKTPLRNRSGITPRKAALNQRAVKAARRPRRDTGPTAEVKEIVSARAVGCCELCSTRLRSAGRWIADHSFHHRRPRGMGGTTRSQSNGPANLLLLCGTGTTGCHGRIEANRTEAYERGWLVGQVEDPREVPVDISIFGASYGLERVLLDDEGGHRKAEA